MTEKRLSNRCWGLWASILWSWSGITAALALLLLLVSQAATVIVIAAVLIIGVLAHIYMRAYWRRFRLLLGDSELHVRSGVWWRKQVLIPFARITNVNLIQGPWQRARELATLKIETAGKSGQSAPETQLWSQEGFEALRDELLGRILSARGDLAGDGTSASIAPAEAGPHWKQMLELLKLIEENTRPGSGKD